MKELREPYTIRSVDLRSLLGITASTLAETYKRLGVQYSDGVTPRHGAARHLDGMAVRRVLENRGFKFPDAAQVISLMMCKGGVGKTTSSFYLAQRLSAYGGRVLVIDGDSQGNLTSAFGLEQYGVDIDASTPILVDVITKACGIEDAIIPVTSLMHLVPSTPMNANLEGRIRDHFKNPSLPIKQAIEPVLADYDYILIDCAPALNLTNTAIISASDLVVLPVAPDKFSQLGLEQTLKEIDQIERDFNLEIKSRIIFTKYDAREFTSLKYLAEIATTHEHRRFSTAIRTCADVKNAITRREDLFAMKKSNAREDYDAFAREIMGVDRAFEKKGSRNSEAA